jgi:hypothetical protein
LTRHTFFSTLKAGIAHGMSITFEMVKVIVPFYIAIEFIKRSGLLDIIGDFCKPFMGLFGLPGECALGLVVGYFVNLYAAIAVLAPLHLPAREITVMALMLGIAHSLPVEAAVTAKTEVNAWILTAARIVLSLLSGAVLNLVWKPFS